MIVTEYMENGSLDSFLRVSRRFLNTYVYLSLSIYVHTYINMEWITENVGDNLWYSAN